MNKLEELEKRLDRIKELMDATGLSMEDLLAESAMVHVDCEKCPIKSICDQFKYDENIACTEIWADYLRGELNKDA